MAYSLGSLDQNLDSLGRSYVDGVTVRLAPKYSVVCDLSEVDRLLRQPGPSVLRSDVHYDTSLERKVLEDLKKRQVDEEEIKVARRLRIEKYDKEKAEEIVRKQKEEEEKALDDERVRLEEIEKEKLARQAEEERRQAERLKEEEEAGLKKKAEEEAEWTKFEEERWRTVKAEAPDPQLQSSSDDGGEEGVPPKFVTPPQEPADVPGPGEIHVVGHQSDSRLNEKINFSDFEALSDPFADLELKTMDDLAELRSILSTNHSSSVVPAVANHGVYPGAPMSGPYPAYYPPTSGYQPQFPSSFSRHYSTTSPVQYSIAPQAQYSTGCYSNPGSGLQYSTASGIQYSTVSSAQYNTPTGSQYSTVSGVQYSTAPGTAQYSTVPGVGYSTPTTNTVYGAGPQYNTPITTPALYGSGSQYSTPITSTPTVYGSGPQYSTPITSTPSVYGLGPQYSTPCTSTPKVYGPQYPSQYSSTPHYPAHTSRSLSSDRRTERLKDEEEQQVGPGVGELKPSRSVGNLITELQRESEALAQAKTSRPNSRPQSRGATGLENWVPWPQLEGEEARNTAELGITDDSCLADLMDDEANSCRQLHEMGFPLSRLAKGCQAVGANHQKLINFCLVVDRLVEEGYPELEASHVAMLHNADEAVCRTHLQSFSHLAEIGFPSKDVHEALIQHSFDHQKALDQLIT